MNPLQDKLSCIRDTVDRLGCSSREEEITVSHSPLRRPGQGLDQFHLDPAESTAFFPQRGFVSALGLREKDRLIGELEEKLRKHRVDSLKSVRQLQCKLNKKDAVIRELRRELGKHKENLNGPCKFSEQTRRLQSDREALLRENSALSARLAEIEPTSQEAAPPQLPTQNLSRTLNLTSHDNAKNSARPRSASRVGRPPQASPALSQQFKTQAQFIAKVTALVVECSPPGPAAGAPPLRQVWKWIRQLLEDYIRLRREVK